MNIKSKLTKPLAQNTKKFIEQFQMGIPISSKIIEDNNIDNFDGEKIKFKEFLETIKEDNTRVGREFQNELKKLKSLSYVNDIVSRPEDKKFLPEDYRNRTDEINKNYEIKKVEGTKNSSRVGLLGYKMGMTAVWDKFGTIMPLTVIKVDNCQVTHLKTVDRDKYNAIQVGMGDKEPKNMTKPIMGHLIKNNIPPKRHFREFIVSPENFLPVGYMISVRHFVPGQLIDIIATSKGKGYQGVMKRWNFKGQFNTHGNSLKHRGAGSIGNREKPGKVWRGKKMAGRLGNERTTLLNFLVYKIDYEKGLIFIKGGLPGNKNGLVILRDAVKRKFEQYQKLLFPTFIPESGKVYPNVFEWDGSEDLNEKYTHDNDEILGVSEEEEEGEAEKNEEEDMMTAKK